MFFAHSHGLAVPHSHIEKTISRPLARKRIGHQRIGFLGIAVARVAPVIFQIIDAPAGIGERVLIFMALAAGPAAAGQPPASE